MPERIIGLAREVKSLVNSNLSEIQAVTNLSRMLAVNAEIEAAHAGPAGRGFSVVAQEVKRVSDQVSQISAALGEQLAGRVDELESLGRSLVAQVRGSRLVDLSLNMIEIVDRNLYERSCDVRWWATDSAVVDACTKLDDASSRFCTKRLGVILDAYTVYLDLWVADDRGRIIANGRPDKFRVAGTDVSRSAWFKQAMACNTGSDFAAIDIEANPRLDNRLVATYGTAVRRGGENTGQPIGAIGVFFDWQQQAQAVVQGVRLTDDERARTRALILDSKHRVIASSDGKGVLSETIRLRPSAASSFYYTDDQGRLVAAALTPGYETYKGLGWFGCMVQEPPQAAQAVRAKAA